MRKKDIIKLNAELFEKAEKLRFEIEELKRENMRLNVKIEELTFKNEELSGLAEIVEPTVVEEKIKEEIVLDKSTAIGATIIGKIIVTATQYCNEITNKNTENAKELINLILGRTEVAKAEILKIVENKELDTELAKSLAVDEQNSAEDYFKSVIAQIE